jgi:hypothetical protein
MKIEQADRRFVRSLIYQCEANLKRRLNAGEYVDFLADNTTYSLDDCRELAIDFCNFRGRNGDEAILKRGRS